MKTLKIFTKLLDANVGSKIFWEGQWYTVVKAIKESVPVDNDEDHSTLILTLR